MHRKDFALTPDQKMDARAAIESLEGSGMSLEEAVRRALEGKRAVKRVLIPEAAADFMRSRQSLRSATAAWYMSRIDRFAAHFADRTLDDVTRADFRAWLKANEAFNGPGQVRAVRAFYAWAMSHEPPLAGQDATAGLPGSGERAADISFLPVKDCKAIMAGAGPYRPALALMLFAGIRPGEVSDQFKPPLTWRCINAAERIIRVPAEASKTGRARIMEGLPDAVWAWLGPIGKDDVAICPYRALQAVKVAQLAAGYGGKKKWPHDALRHSFATYHVAAFANPGSTAMLMGHEGNPTMLHRHYRGLATKAEAEAFWALRPTGN